MSVTAEIGVSVSFEALVPIGIRSDSLPPRGLQILHEVDCCVSVGRSLILIESGALMRRVVDIQPGALIQEVEISHACFVVEALVKRKSGIITPKNLVGKG